VLSKTQDIIKTIGQGITKGLKTALGGGKTASGLTGTGAAKAGARTF